MEIQELLLALLSFLVGGVLFFVRRYVTLDPGVGAWWDKNEIIINAVANVVLSIARNTDIITGDEWASYEEEAVARAVDPRLIAALREVSQILEYHNIIVPERLLLHLIETEYAKIRDKE